MGVEVGVCGHDAIVKGGKIHFMVAKRLGWIFEASGDRKERAGTNRRTDDLVAEVHTDRRTRVVGRQRFTVRFLAHILGVVAPILVILVHIQKRVRSRRLRISYWNLVCFVFHVDGRGGRRRGMVIDELTKTSEKHYGEKSCTRTSQNVGWKNLAYTILTCC